MVASQNGWAANNPALVSSRLAPGTTVKLTVRNGAAGDALLFVAGWYDRIVENIDNAVGALDDWGFAERPIRGGVELSNHASGTAIDLNATKHPLGTDPHTNFSAAQLAAIRIIANACILHGKRLIRWGGDYGDPANGGVRGSRPDGMHWEVNDGVTEAELAALLQVFHGIGAAPAPAAPAPAPAGRATIKIGDTGQLVWDLQRKLTTSYGLYNNYTPNGIFGPQTDAGVKEFQRRSGLTADGVVGPATWHALGF